MKCGRTCDRSERETNENRDDGNLEPGQKGCEWRFTSLRLILSGSASKGAGSASNRFVDDVVVAKWMYFPLFLK